MKNRSMRLVQARCKLSTYRACASASYTTSILIPIPWRLWWTSRSISISLQQLRHLVQSLLCPVGLHSVNVDWSEGLMNSTVVRRRMVSPFYKPFVMTERKEKAKNCAQFLAACWRYRIHVICIVSMRLHVPRARMTEDANILQLSFGIFPTRTHVQPFPHLV